MMRLAALSRVSHVMPDLSGRSILIVEDEPLIALDVATAFRIPAPR